MTGLGCSKSQPTGTRTATVSYNCCDGTECYEPDPENWKRSEDEECALQKCASTDDVQFNLSGTQYRGYCKTAGPDSDGKCNEGEDCDKIYKVIGYCSSCEESTYPKWEKSRYMDVDYDPYTTNSQARCCRQQCKTASEVKADNPCMTNPAKGTFTNNSYCNVRDCGPKTDTQVCNLSCQSGYYPAQASGTNYPLGTCCYQNCPAFPYGTSCPANPANGYYVNNSTCSSRCTTATQVGYAVTTKCNMYCNSGFHSEDGKTCISNTRYNQACSVKPANTDWNSVSSITQTWNGSWSPLTASTYNTTASTTECRYKCASNHTWNGSSCVLATQTCTCPAKSGGASTVWNRVSSYTQTWTGTGWNYACGPTTYNINPANFNCRYKCASNYTRSGGSCVANTQTATCGGSLPSNTSWSNGSTYIQTWNGSSWSPSGLTAHYGTDACGYQCSSSYTWNGSSCAQTVYDCARCAKYMDHQWVVFKSTYADCRAANVGSAKGSCNTSCHAAAQPARDGCYCKCP